MLSGWISKVSRKLDSSSWAEAQLIRVTGLIAKTGVILVAYLHDGLLRCHEHQHRSSNPQPFYKGSCIRSESSARFWQVVSVDVQYTFEELMLYGGVF